MVWVAVVAAGGELSALARAPAPPGQLAATTTTTTHRPAHGVVGPELRVGGGAHGALDQRGPATRARWTAAAGQHTLWYSPVATSRDAAARAAAQPPPTHQMGPGATAFTRMPRPTSLLAMLRAKPCCAPLDAVYDTRLEWPRNALMLVHSMMVHPAWSFMCLTAAPASHTLEKKLACRAATRTQPHQQPVDPTPTGTPATASLCPPRPSLPLPLPLPRFCPGTHREDLLQVVARLLDGLLRERNLRDVGQGVNAPERGQPAPGPEVSGGSGGVALA